MEMKIRLLLILLLMTRCASEYQKAEKHFDLGNYEEAKLYYELVTSESKDYENAKLRMLEIERIKEKDNFDKALRAFKEKEYADAELWFLQIKETSIHHNQAKVFLSRIDSIKELWKLDRARLEKIKKVEAEKTARSKLIEEAKAAEQIRKQVRVLFNSLLGFKDKSDFYFYGFGVGYKYNKWLKDVKDLKANPDARLLINYGFLVGDLEMLGLEYSGSKGKETEYSKWARKRISEGLGKQGYNNL